MGRARQRSAPASWNGWATHSSTRSSVSMICRLRRAASFRRSCRWRSRPSRSLDQLLNAIGYVLPQAFAAGDDQHRIISSDRPDDLLPSSLVQGLSNGAGRAAGSLQHEKWSHPIYADQQRRQDQAQLGADGPPMWVGVVGTTSRIGQLRQTQLANVPRQGGLSYLEALFHERLSQPVLALDAAIAHDSQDGGMPLGLHTARYTSLPPWQVRRTSLGPLESTCSVTGRWSSGMRITVQSPHFPGTRLPVSLPTPSARAPASVQRYRSRSGSSDASLPAARASASRSRRSTLTTLSVPNPTRTPAFSSAASGAAPWPC